ncbi:DNA polymerase IV [Deinococcus maricopensis]|uniref:DNA polymerase IV n=1 Tax=Deinococcus maricopensis (strain DSM 21211 / LMG 22137 / NRRL B-23946 / LB-34) TaxID=709986 RepID=E8UA37_DEIML|nr:DNA polymerase IV [Deinococcus maricopensis]ADV67926.1 DNA polymerase IV [Deinococcus maricopensis DSM 21211]
METRKIIHVDMDAFYASVEVRDDPRLRGRPVAVAWGGNRSVVLTASYEARPYGVRSAMPLHHALARCRDLVVVPPRFDAYREVSVQVQEVFRTYTDVVEPLSLDEAYLDVTAAKAGGPSATRIAAAIRADIRAATGLTATAGVSVNKFLAKLASGLQKPDALTVLLLAQAEALLATLDVRALHGVGPATARRLAEAGVRTGGDLRRLTEAELTGLFGRLGAHLYRVVRGVDDRPVEADRPHKSIGAEETFPHDLHGVPAVRAALPALADAVERRLERAGVETRVVVLKLKFADFTTVTRRATLPVPVRAAADLTRVAARLLMPEMLGGRGVRLVGITGAGLSPQGQFAQVPLFTDLLPTTPNER